MAFSWGRRKRVMLGRWGRSATVKDSSLAFARRAYFFAIFFQPVAAAQRTAPRREELGGAAWRRGRFVLCTSPYTGCPTLPPARRHVHPTPFQPDPLPAVRRAQPMRHGSRPPTRKLLVHDPAHRTGRPGSRARSTTRQGLRLPGLRRALQQRSATLCTPARACADMIAAFCGDTP